MISVAMCTYNGEKYVKEQLMSIISQTVLPDEIVICDDRSSDNTIDVVKKALKDWNGICQIIVNEKNLGYRKNFERAIELCHGEYIFLSDQDDVWDSKKIEYMINEIKKDEEILLVFHDAELVDHNLESLGITLWQRLGAYINELKNNDFRRILESNVVQGSACLIKRELFEYATPFPEIAVHDEWLALVAIAKGKIYPLNLVLSKYRQSESNAIGAGTISLYTRIKKWTMSRHNTSSQYLKLSYEHQMVISYFCHRYKNDLTGKKKLFLLYDDFLIRRINWIKNKETFNIVKSFEYSAFGINKLRVLRIKIKDILASLFRE